MSLDCVRYAAVDCTCSCSQEAGRRASFDRNRCRSHKKQKTEDRKQKAKANSRRLPGTAGTETDAAWHRLTVKAWRAYMCRGLQDLQRLKVVSCCLLVPRNRTQFVHKSQSRLQSLTLSLSVIPSHSLLLHRYPAQTTFVYFNLACGRLRSANLAVNPHWEPQPQPAAI